MIYDTTAPLGRVIRERSIYENGPPCGCGGHIEGRTLPLWRQTFGGEVEFRCDRCGRIETAAERAAKDKAQADILDSLNMRTCAREGCNSKVESLARTYCGRICANMVRAQEREYSQRARRREKRKTIGTERMCVCGCGQTFRVQTIYGKSRQYFDATCRVRAHDKHTDRYARERANRRDNALKQLRAFFATHGYAPTRADLGLKTGTPRHPDAPAGASLKLFFGSVSRAYELAGVPSRGNGEHVERVA